MVTSVPTAKFSNSSGNCRPREEISTDADASSEMSSEDTGSAMAFSRLSSRRAAARDHIGLVVEPEPTMLLQHAVGGFEIAAIADHLGQSVVLDLRHLDRGVPGREQGRGADRATDLVRQRVHAIAEDRTGIRGGIEIIV